MNPNPHPEGRLYPRERRSDALLWRTATGELFRTGWLLEASNSGLAFAWRGVAPPKVNTVVELDGEGGRPSHAVVRRVDTAHQDLQIIALEHVHRRPFAEAAHAEATRSDDDGHAIEAKPMAVVVPQRRCAA